MLFVYNVTFCDGLCGCTLSITTGGAFIFLQKLRRSVFSPRKQTKIIVEDEPGALLINIVVHLIEILCLDSLEIVKTLKGIRSAILYSLGYPHQQ